MTRRSFAGTILAASVPIACPPKAGHLVLYGDSISAGYGQTVPWPNGLSGGLTLANLAFNGNALYSGGSNAAQATQFLTPGARNLAILFLGTNDGANGQTVGDTFARLLALGTGLLAAGWTNILPVTMASRGDKGPGLETWRAAYNAEILTQWPPILGKPIDMTASSIGAPDACENLDLFLPDKVHPNDAGAAVILSYVNEAIASWRASV